MDLNANIFTYISHIFGYTKIYGMRIKIKNIKDGVYVHQK